MTERLSLCKQLYNSTSLPSADGGLAVFFEEHGMIIIASTLKTSARILPTVELSHYYYNIKWQSISSVGNHNN